MIWSGFIVGLIGSLHCFVMCGPIALALPMPNGASRILGIFLYNIGRAITYAFIGTLFGFLGSLFVLSGYQQILSLLSGALLILMAIAHFLDMRILSAPAFIYSNLGRVKSVFNKLFSKRSFTSLFLLGMVNGILPCGLVYMALVGAIATGEIFKGASYMFLFGLGTIPMMALLSWTGNKLQVTWRKPLLKSLPFMVGVMGIVLVLRGLNLGIPNLSPKVEQNEKVVCCHKP